ncbi:MAG: hypothetical protein ABI807_12675 [Sporichthyaceae bacterium]
MPPVRRVVALLRPAALGGAGVVAVLALLGPAAPAAASTTPCVGVVVDGRLTGGALRTACAPGDPDSGLEALTKAGISYAFVPRQPGQVCQLDGLPACSDTGAVTYWSYWWRAKGSSRWVYATTGAGSHDPEPGDTEAWVWQDGGRRQPPDVSFARICPQAAPAAQGSRTATPGTASGPARSSSTEAVQVPTATSTSSTTRKATTGKATTRGPTTAATPSTPSTSSTGTPSPAAAVSNTGPAAAATRPGAAGPDDDPASGAPWAGLAVGTALVAGLGGAAVVRTRRRPT